MSSSVLFTVRTALFAAVLSVCAVIAVPMPLTAIPVTLLTLGLFLTGLLLPPKSACIAALLHLLLGVVGLPVFSGMTGGPGVLLGPTGGFLLAGPVAILTISRLSRQLPEQPFRPWIALSVGLLLVDLAGTAWYCLTAGVPFTQGLILCVLPFLPADALKMAAAIVMGRSLKKFRVF